MPQGGDHNIVQVTSFDNNQNGAPRGYSYTNASINEVINMLAGGPGTHDYNGLVGMRTFAGQMTTIQWWAIGFGNVPQGECIGGGTISPH